MIEGIVNTQRKSNIHQAIKVLHNMIEEDILKLMKIYNEELSFLDLLVSSSFSSFFFFLSSSYLPFSLSLSSKRKIIN